MAMLLIIRYVLATENKRRDQEQLDNSYDDIYIERIGKDGQVEEIKVDKVNKYLCSTWCNTYFVQLSARNFWISQIFRIVISDMFCSITKTKFYQNIDEGVTFLLCAHGLLGLEAESTARRCGGKTLGILQKCLISFSRSSQIDIYSIHGFCRIIDKYKNKKGFLKPSKFKGAERP